MMDCIGTESDHQNDRLNSVYLALEMQTTDILRSRLKDQQQQWLSTLDSNCAGDHLGGGTAQMLADEMCRLERTAARADQLEATLRCGERTDSCN